MTSERGLRGALGRVRRRAEDPAAPAAAPDAFVARAARAVEYVRSAHPEGAVLLGYFPAVNVNPVQWLLYKRCWEHGIAPVAMTSLDELEDLAAAGARPWLHLHWTHPVLRRSATEEQARSRVRRFAQRLEAFGAAGGRIAWTVHNVLPHEVAFPEIEAEVCRAVAERADLIHTLCPSTPRATEPWYRLPEERIRCLPLPSYLGAYPNTVSQAQARLDLGLAAGDTVLAFVGSIRPYKGLGRFLDAFETVRAQRPHFRALVAGEAQDFDGLDALRVRCEADPSVIAHFGRVHERNLQRYLNAADVVVLPYTEILNSGACLLAFSFARPVVVPRRGCLAELMEEDAGVLFDPAAASSLERALLEADRLKDPRHRAAALRVAQRCDPDDVSLRFAELFRAAETERAGALP